MSLSSCTDSISINQSSNRPIPCLDFQHINFLISCHEKLNRVKRIWHWSWYRRMIMDYEWEDKENRRIACSDAVQWLRRSTLEVLQVLLFARNFLAESFGKKMKGNPLVRRKWLVILVSVHFWIFHSTRFFFLLYHWARRNSYYAKCCINDIPYTI